MIIGLSGYAKSGKDTAGKIIQQLTTPKPFRHVEDEFGNPLRDSRGYDYVLREEPPRFQIKKYSAKLKKMAGEFLGVDPERFEDQDFKESKLGKEWDYMTVRQFLQKFGTDAIRNGLHPDAWINALMSDYKDSSDWVIVDVRFPNEAKAIKERDGIIIRLNRYPPGCSPAFMDLHESEIALDEWQFDEKIWNLGTIDDLRSQIREILKKLEKKNLVVI